MTDVAPGVQPERTALAWRRTALSLAVGALVGGRVLEPWLGPPVWVAAVAAVLAAVVLARAGDRRAARWADVLDARTDRTPGGRLLAGTAAGALALGVAALVVVLRHAAG
jgi:uncharacterized membrane protein YidH (DUF202 family)